MTRDSDFTPKDDTPGAGTLTRTEVAVVGAAPTSSATDNPSLIDKNTRRLVMNERDQPATSASDTAGAACVPANSVVTKVTASTYLEQAKDRAQITAATSMSIVHVALLKDTLDAGRSNNSYYTWTLSLIIAALAIQIIAGLLALYVALLRNYYNEYKDDFLGDCSKIFCPCKIRRRRRGYKGLKIISTDATDDVTPLQPVAFNVDEEEGCCPFKCVLNHFDDFDYRVLELYEAWSEKAIQADIDCANIEEQIKSLRVFIDTAKETVTKFDTDHADTLATVAENQKNDEVKEQLSKDEGRMQELERAQQAARTLRTQGDVLRRYVENIGRERVLKRTTFWQNCLNIMLYIVFILNAVIVGFGLTARTSAGGQGGNSTAQS